MEIRFTREAKEQLRGIKMYIEVDSPQYAGIYLKRLTNRIKYLKEYPSIGRVVPEFGLKQIREIIHSPYRIIYRICDDRIEILTIIHSKMDIN